MRPTLISALLVCSGLMVGLTTPRAHAEDSAGDNLRVLFIGNSFTRFNNLPRMVRRLLDADGVGPAARVRFETRTGATLRRLWQSREVRTQISSGGYTHVVLQGHSLRPANHPEELAEYARRLDALVDEAGGHTVLYATWARIRHADDVPPELASPAAMQARIRTVYGELGRELAADVAPVGDAFARAGATASEITLYRDDGIHPTPAGTYLAACVFYRVLTGRAASGLSYRPWPMRRATAARLQEIADGE